MYKIHAHAGYARDGNDVGMAPGKIIIILLLLSSVILHKALSYITHLHGYEFHIDSSYSWLFQYFHVCFPDSIRFGSSLHAFLAKSGISND